MSFVAPPNLQAPPGGEHRPMKVRLTTSLSDVNFQGGDTSMIQVLADAILQYHDAEISGWVNALRQQTAINPLGYMDRSLSFSDCSVTYTRNGQDEVLDIVVRPNPSTSEGAPLSSGGTYDVECPFTGYAVGQLQTQGLYTWCGFNLLDDGALSHDDEPFGFPASWGVPSVGRTGVLITPLSGLQYLEAEIVSLPKRTPAEFTVLYAGIDDGSFVDWAPGHIQPNEIVYSFPAALNTWLTPAIGFIPSQQFNDDWIKNITVDDMLVGLEKDDTFQIARSVYCVTSTIERSDVQTKSWSGAQYWINNPSQVDNQPQSGVHTLVVPSEGTRVDYAYSHQAGPALETRWNLQCQITEEDWNPIFIKNSPTKPTITVGGGYVGAKAKPPIVRGDQAGVGVAGKYVMIPAVTLQSMPIDTFKVGDIPGAIAATDAVNRMAIDDLIASDEAIGNTDTYVPLEAFADPREWGSGVAIQSTLPYLHGFPQLWIIVAEPDVTTDAPTPIDDTVFINGGFQTVKQILGSLGYQAGGFVSDDYAAQAVIGDYFEGPGSDISQNSGFVELLFEPTTPPKIAFLYQPNPQYTPLSGVNATGTHTWVFKGRGDLLADGHTATDDGPLIPPLGGNGGTFNAIWSGVDLGVLALDDVITMAIDTGSRKVWYGLNGKWYDKNGVSPYAPGDPRLLPSVLLDGEPSQNYYPACTLRVGASHVRFLWGQATKFPRPSGFDDYVG